MLQPSAEAIDRAERIPRTHLDQLRESGLYGVGTDAGVAREVHRALARGCGATAFLWVQHMAVHRQAVASGSAALAADLGSGRRCAGIMFAHLRRPSATLRATRDGSVWRIDGEAPWATGWGLVDLFGVGAETGDGRIVWFVLPADRTAGVHADLLDLSVMNATRTATVRFDGLRVGDDDVILIEKKEAWIGAGRAALASPPFAAIGLAERAAEMIDADSPLQAEVAETLAAARRLVEGPVDLDAWGAFRTEAILLGIRAAAAAVAVGGGAAMDLHHPAQRLAREAMFYLVWQQSPGARSALAARLAEPPGAEAAH